MAGVSLNLHNSRSKKFVSCEHLSFEKGRLETFIDWPVSWLKPTDLAHDGFYYLRTKDHCACAFCHVILGAWEKGDTPRGEHQRHCPDCPFVKGQQVGNIPLEDCHITSPMSPRYNASSPEISETERNMPGYFEGMVKYSGHNTHDYNTYESRLGSYVRWPERVKQKPKELSEAGFYYCGLSDHVRCFHCGNGLCNWETDGIPWREHAHWYPNCNFVLLTKGQEFIEQIRREDIDIGANEANEAIGMATSSNDIEVPCAVPVQTPTTLVKELENILESRMCKVCMDAEMSVVFFPCTHVVTCTSCALAISQCPICLEDIKSTIKPILSNTTL